MMKLNSNSNEADAAPDEDASVINLDELYNENYSEDSIARNHIQVNNERRL